MKANPDGCRLPGWNNSSRRRSDLLPALQSTFMTNAQILTIVIAIGFPVLMLIYSNSRTTEAKEILRVEMQAMRAEMKVGFEQIRHSSRSTNWSIAIDRQAIARTLFGAIVAVTLLPWFGH